MNQNHSNFYNIDGSCELYSIENFNNEFKNKNGLLILNFNIRSFNSNFDEFSEFLTNLNIRPDILVLTETWFNENQVGDIDGFQGYHCTRSTGCRGGGVSIFINASLNVKI